MEGASSDIPPGCGTRFISLTAAVRIGRLPGGEDHRDLHDWAFRRGWELAGRTDSVRGYANITWSCAAFWN
jgi:hypothetical protein